MRAQWIGEPETARGVEERRFDIDCQGRRVPALLWTPEGAEVRGIALLGHGGSLHKRADYVLATARRIVRRHGFAAVAIDGPAHGERRDDGGRDPAAVDADFDKAWQRAEASDEVVADWKSALDAVEEVTGGAPVAYFGLSMGTMMGLPLIAAEPRIGAAVLGLMGTWGPNRTRLEADAPTLRCPVRFLVQWDDEIVPRERALDLFDRIGAPEKSLRAHPGRHVEVPPDEMRAIPEFLARTLGA